MKKTSALLGLIVCLGLSSNIVWADFREHFDLGQSYLSQYQYSGAITEFKNALRINYMDTSARIGLINAYLARGAQYANKEKAWDKAADDYRSALFYLKYYPKSNGANNSSQIIPQVVNNLDRCLNEIQYDRSPQNRYNTAKTLRAEGNFSAAAYEFNQSLGAKDLQKSSFEQVGDIMVILGNKPKAVEYYKKAVAVSPSDLDLRLTYAKTLDDIESHDEALKEYSYVLEKSKPTNKEVLYILERTFSKKLDQNPNNANLNANYGAVLQKENRLDEALSYYKKAESLDPSNINTRINVGTLYQQKEDYRTAIKAYESVLILYPDNLNANLYRAQCYDKLGDSKIAQEGFRKVLSISPDNALVKEQLIESRKKELSAVQFAEYIKTNFPENNPSEMLYDYAIELHKANKIDDAVYMYYEAIKLSADKATSEMYVNLALAQAQDGKYDEALTTLNNAKTKFPTDKNITNTLANISNMRVDNMLTNAAELYNRKKYKEAASAYQSIIPQSANSMLGAATCFQELGDKDKAIEYYKKALEFKPVDSDIAYYIAALYGEKEDYVNAKIYLGKSIAFNKNNQQAIDYLHSIEEMDRANLLNEAINKYEAQKYDESLSDLNKLLAKEPKNGYALYYRGMIYDAQSKHNEAIADLKKAYEINKEFTICPYMIASNYDSLEKYKEAYEYYTMYANSNVEDDDYKKYAAARAEELKEHATAKK